MTAPAAAASSALEATPPALSLSHVSKSFGGVMAVSDVSFEVTAGSFTAIIGPNGAGKTTLFNLVTNLFPPTHGSVTYFGKPLRGVSGSRLARLGLIRTFQAARVFPGMTALDNIKTGGHLLTTSGVIRQVFWTVGARAQEKVLAKRAAALLDIAGLSRFADSQAHDLPIGAQKVVEVLRALMACPRLLLLDEPAAGLNDTETAKLTDLIRAICTAGITIVVVEHNMSLVMGADRVIVLDAGRLIAEGTPSEISRNKSVIEAYLGEAGRGDGA